jgi:hypothetical protein
MFYQDIPKDQINDPQIDKIYERVKPYIGQLVLDGHSVVRFIGLLRDDAFDGEWCYRLVSFPSPWYRSRLGEVADHSVLACPIIPLKGRITDEEYDDLESSWAMNLERCPYSKDHTVYDKTPRPDPFMGQWIKN